MIAMANNGDVLRYVPKDLDDYGENAKIAVAQNGDALQFVPPHPPRLRQD